MNTRRGIGSIEGIMLLVLLFALVRVGKADTVIIDFNGVPPFTDFPTYSEDGFTLTPSVGAVRINDAFSPGDNAAQPSFGFGQGVDSSFTFTNDSSVPFDAVSIDLLEATGSPDTFGVTIIGTKTDLSTVTHTFTLDGIAGKQTFSFSSDFTGLISLKIAEDSTNSFFTDIVQVDNVELTVPTVPTFNFTGFFQPVDNLPVLNEVTAGRAIPVQFSLDGDQGLDIFAGGYPKSQDIPCDSTALINGIEQTVTAGSSSLSYNPNTDQYNYVWKTEKAWSETCRQLVVKLIDNSVHRANFKFK